MHWESNNVGAFITSKIALDNTTFGAGAGNIAQQNGNLFNRTAERPLHLSGKYQFGYKATLASGHSASFTYALQDSADGTNFTDVAGASGVTSLTALNSGALQRGVMELNVNLIGTRQYVRPRLTPVMSNSGVDVITVAGIFALGGGETLPPTGTPA